MLRSIVDYPFRQFNRSVLTPEENKTLDQGSEKHYSILLVAVPVLVVQVNLSTLAPDLYLMMSAMSFFALLLGAAWYIITFQNVSEDQLNAGVATFITKKMFRAFLLCMQSLGVCILLFLGRTLLPEIASMIPKIEQTPIPLRVFLFLANAAWVLLVIADIYFASVAYDAMDSLLADALPTIMRGARANTQNLPLLHALETLIALQQAMCEKQGISVPTTEQQHVEE